MQIIYWPDSFQAHLRSLFEYNPETGYVTRKRFGSRGPKSKGPCGYMTPNGDLSIALDFEGRRWNVRVARLAIFLMTNQQYQSVRYKDRDKLNTKYDNLEPNSALLQPGMVTMEEQEFLKFERINNYRRARYRAELAEKQRSLMEHQSSSGEPSEEIVRRVDHQDPVLSELAKVWTEVNKEFRAERHLLGLPGNFVPSDLEDFLNDTDRVSQFMRHDCLRLFRLRREDSEWDKEYSALPIWQKHRIAVCYTMEQFARGEKTKQQYENQLRQIPTTLYRTESFVYNDWRPEHRARYEGEKVRIEKEYAETGKVTPYRPPAVQAQTPLIETSLNEVSLSETPTATQSNEAAFGASGEDDPSNLRFEGDPDECV